MNDEVMRSIVAITTAIIGLAVLSVIVSKNANTTNVIQAAASGFNNSIATAISPVTGSQTTIDLSYPQNNSTLGAYG